MNNNELASELGKLLALARKEEDEEIPVGPTNREIQKAWGLGRARVQRLLRDWIDGGLVEAVTVKVRSPITKGLHVSYRYVLTEEGKARLGETPEGAIMPPSQTS